MPPSDPSRIQALDLIRGIAVLGILAVNIACFAGPMAAADSPSLFLPGGRSDHVAVALVFVLFEGKMRALFSLLFGASMCLFIERIDAGGRDGAALQLRRLGWLLLFGWLHYMLFWWGDILFVYALCGMVALAWRRLPARAMVAVALLTFAVWHGNGIIENLPEMRAEEQVRQHAATPAQAAATGDALAARRARMAEDLHQVRLGYAAQVADKWHRARLWPLVMTEYTIGETLPLMLIGVVLYRGGFFSGGWSRRRLRLMAGWGVGLGGAMTLALLAWAWPRGFPLLAMVDITAYVAAPAHLLMALGYAAALMLAAPHLLASRLGQRLAAAGRMAFSNYLGTTMLMTAIFYGWGLGLIGRVGHAAQLGFVVLGWALMLAWSKPWLAHFRQGPLEWLWRSLTEWRRMPMRRRSSP